MELRLFATPPQGSSRARTHRHTRSHRTIMRMGKDERGPTTAGFPLSGANRAARRTSPRVLKAQRIASTSRREGDAPLDWMRGVGGSVGRLHAVGAGARRLAMVALTSVRLEAPLGHKLRCRVAGLAVEDLRRRSSRG